MNPIGALTRSLNGNPEWQIWMVVAVVALLFAAAMRPSKATSRPLCAGLDGLSRHRRATIGFFFVLPILLRISLLPLMPVPVVMETDEFSYLLGADTLAHGRLTNPSPPHPEFFEAEHINVTPSYQSMFPPAQSGFLALGEVMFHQPWAGVLLSVGLMCAAIYWSLLVFVPGRWAFFATLLCVLRFALVSEIANSYMGGAVAALSGALLLGALKRWERRPRKLYGVLVALALLLLANSRPYEGLLFALIPCCAFLWHVGKRGPEWRRWRRGLSLATFVLAVGFLFLGYFNRRGTGHALEMPYTTNMHRYHITRLFLWQPRQEIPAFTHLHMLKNAVRWEYMRYLELTQPNGLRRQELEKLELGYRYYFRPWGLLALYSSLIMLRSRKLRVVPLTFALLILGALALSWPVFPRYDAVAIILVMITLVHGLRVLRTLRLPALGGLRTGPALQGSAVTIISIVLLLNVADSASIPYSGNGANLMGVKPEMDSQLRRLRIERQLEQMPGKHIVFVYYPPESELEPEWVYNSADIAGQKVIWAVWMGDHNAALLHDFAGRQAWMVNEKDPSGRIILLH